MRISQPINGYPHQFAHQFGMYRHEAAQHATPHVRGQQ